MKLDAFHRHLHVTGDLHLINIDQFSYMKNTKNVLQF